MHGTAEAKICQNEGQTDGVSGITTPAVVQSDSSGTILQEPEYIKMNPYISQLLQTDENTQNYSGDETLCPALKTKHETNHIIYRSDHDKIQDTEHVQIQLTSTYHKADLQLCLGGNIAGKDFKSRDDSSVNQESFQTKGQTNIQTVQTEQLPDMGDPYSCYMDSINYSSCELCVKGFLNPTVLEEHLEKHFEEHILMHAEDLALDRTFSLQ